MKRGIGWLLLAIAGGYIGFGLADAQDQRRENVRQFMRQKLEHANRVLEGLALEDYQLVGQHAQSLGVLSRATAWQVLQTPDYLRYSAEFEQASQKLVQSARERNLDGATLAYVQVTFSCVNCHKHVRSVKMAAGQPPAPDAARKEAKGT